MLCGYRRPFLLALLAFLAVHGATSVAQEAPSAPGNNSAQPKPDITEIPITPTQPVPVPSTPSVPPIKFPNFASCPIAELQRQVPQLAHLKADSDQTKLNELLDKIGAKTVEIVRRTPNLISQESVVTDQGNLKTHENYSYLVVQHSLGPKGTVLDEFRVDLKTGKKFEGEGMEKAAENTMPSLSDLELPTIPSAPLSEDLPSSQGFVNEWLHFYPSNRSESDFRYLGQQKIEGHLTYVVAFAQKPGSVRLPARIGLENKTLPIFLQGIAWVDASDFRIVRQRTDLLSAPAESALRQLTADIQFSEVHLAETAGPLWLPRQLVVTTKVADLTRRETHNYSNYRLFRTRSKLLLAP